MRQDGEKDTASSSPSPVPVPAPSLPPPHPALSYIEASPPLHGQSLYLGGELGPDGNIYCIPGHANRVLAIYPNTNKSIISEEEQEEEQGEENEVKEKCIQIGPEFIGKFKWLRGIRACNGIIYGLPCHADSILRIDARGSEGNDNGNDSGKVKISTIPIPYDTFYNLDNTGDKGQLKNENEKRMKIKHEKEMKWKYHGGAISPIDNCIYCIPQSASHVLKIDPNGSDCDNENKTETVSFVGQELPGKYKWYGGLVGLSDGAIYGIPQNSGCVLRICPESNTNSSGCDNNNNNKSNNNDTGVSITLHGSFDTNHAWHGGGLSSDGTIVCIPNNADTVLLIKPPHLLPPKTQTVENGKTTEHGNGSGSGSVNVQNSKNCKVAAEPELCIIGGPDVIATGINSGRLDKKYKYLGSASDEDCNVYCFPSGAEHVLRVNTSTMKVDEIGPSLYESKLERLKQNKWQNGFYCPTDKCIYGIPLAAETVLKIDLKERRCNSTSSGGTGTDIDDRCKGEPLVTTMGLPLEPYGGLAKWEGGVMTENGTAMYCMPNNFKRVLKITPTSTESAERTNAM